MQDTKLVLIADDDPDIVELISTFISSLDCLIITALDGEQALTLVENNNVDVIISDIAMPKLDGIKLLKALLARGHTQPFIFLTGNPSQENTAQALRLGAFDFLDKPCRSQDLLKVVRRALEHKKDANLTALGQQGLDNLQEFAENAAAELAFAQAAVDALTNPEHRAGEAAFLMRIFVSIDRAAQSSHLTDIAQVADAGAGFFTKLRLGQIKATPDNINTARALSQWMRDAVDALSTSARLKKTVPSLLARVSGH